MSKKKANKVVCIKTRDFRTVMEYVNSINGFKCSMNERQADIIISNDPQQSDKIQMSFEQFKETYQN